MRGAVPQPPAQRGSRAPAHTPGQGLRVPVDQDMFIAEARARVGKLQVAKNALGENGPAVRFLKEALRVAQAQRQERLVDQRIKATQEFIARAKKRIQAREEVTRAQEAADAVITKLRIKGESLQQGEARFASLQREAEGAPQRQVLPPVPSDLADKLAHVRECGNDLLRERDELCSQVDVSDRDGQVERRKKPKSLATPSLDLMITDHHQGWSSRSCSTRQTQQFEGTGSTLWHTDDLEFRQNFSKIWVARREGGRSGAPGASADPRVLLDPASQWSEVPTTVAATSREVDTAHRSPPSTVVASAGEVARVLGQDVSSTVVGSS